MIAVACQGRVHIMDDDKNDVCQLDVAEAIQFGYDLIGAAKLVASVQVIQPQV
jgi:hypothetical protein